MHKFRCCLGGVLSLGYVYGACLCLAGVTDEQHARGCGDGDESEVLLDSLGLCMDGGVAQKEDQRLGVRRRLRALGEDLQPRAVWQRDALQSEQTQAQDGQGMERADAT